MDQEPFSAYASAYSMFFNHTFHIGKIEIEIDLTLRVLAIGGGFSVDLTNGKGAITPPSAGVVPTIGWSIKHEDW